MNYQDTLRVAMDAYPSVHPDEADALDHFFFVIGNGYHWEKGELVVAGHGGTPDEQIAAARADRLAHLESQVDAYAQEPDDRSLAEYYQEWLQRERHASPAELRDAARQRRRELVEAGDWDEGWAVLPDGRVQRRIYPVSAYSKIMTVPTDVTSDWFAAALKAIALAFSELCTRTARDEVQLRQAAKRLVGLRPELGLSVEAICGATTYASGGPL